MKKFPKLLQCDKRGQIVIPKEMRRELNIDEGTGFWAYVITDEGILLKKVDAPDLSEHQEVLNEIADKSEKINVSTSNVKKSTQAYKKTQNGGFDLV